VEVCREDARQLKEGPSGPIHRSKSQTGISCVSKKRGQGALRGEGIARQSEVRFREENASELLMRYPKEYDDARTGG